MVIPKPGFKLSRHTDYGIYYDSDFGFTIPIRQRTQKDENGNLKTPLTPMFLARQVTTDCKVPVAKDFEPRYVNACFVNPDNDTGESNIKVIIPYRPTDQINHRAHMKEVRTSPDVAAIDYKGETHTSSIARYFR